MHGSFFVAEIADTKPNKEGDAFAAIVKAQNENEPEVSAIGGTLARASISEQVSNRILMMIKSGNLRESWSDEYLPS